MRVSHILFVVAAAALRSGLAPPDAGAQQRELSPDSVVRQLRTLQQRVDSLERELRRVTGGPADTAQETGDELAALRAAARAAAGPAGDSAAAAADTTPVEFVGRTRMLSQLNPEISVTGDVRLAARDPGPQSGNFEFREFEFAFQSPLDPYAQTKIFASFEEGAFGIEEAYAYWTGLPGHLRLDLGRFRQQLGELNRWHLHGLPESEYPLALQRFTGEDGLVGDGVGLYWVAPTEGRAVGTHELWAQATLASNEVLFQGGDRVAVLGHLNNFWQLSPSTFVQLGATVLYGENPDSLLKTRLLGGDIRVSWRPPDRALYRSFTLRAEGWAIRQQVAGAGPTRRGGYLGAEYQLSRRIFAGLRYDYARSLGAGTAEWMMVPHLTWWQSEWVYLRAELQHHSTPAAGGGRERSDRLLVQAVWSIGPHKHETY